jgi:hypothetical protein
MTKTATDDLRIISPMLWNLFFWFAGMASLFIWNSILSLNDYWNKAYQDGIAAWYPFFYFGGSFINFFLFEYINRCFKFNQQCIYIPAFMGITFYAQWLVGYYIDDQDSKNMKVVIFLIIVFIQGFANNTLQTSLARFCFNFRGKDITHYTAGTALVGVFVAGVAFILQLTINDLNIQYWVY